MLDWVGSLRVREQSSLRVVLGLTRATRLAGLTLITVGLMGCWSMWERSLLLLLPWMVVAALGITVATLRRELVFDRGDGTLAIRQGLLGVGTSLAVPLFHLRAVVVLAKARNEAGAVRYVAYLDRRVGDQIYLDEAKRCAGLLSMAEAIADVAEIRLEYDSGAGATASSTGPG